MRVRKRVIEAATTTWTTLNRELSSMNSEEVLYAMELENAREKPRKSFLKRLGQRYHGILAEGLRRELR